MRKLLSAALLILGVLGLAPSARASCASQNTSHFYADVVALAPSAYYPLTDANGSGTALDCSGNGNTATATSVTFGATGLLTGSTDTAASFNGSTSILTLPYTTIGAGHPLALECNTAYHLEMLVSVPSSPSGQLIINAIASSPYNGFAIGVTSGRQVNVNYKAASGAQLAFTTTGTALSVGTHLITIIYTGSGLAAGFTVLFDGAVEPIGVAQDTLGGLTCASSNSIASPHPVTIGGAAVYGSYNGSIMELAFYPVLNPEGTLPHKCCAGNVALDTLAIYHANLMLRDAAPIANPAGARKVIFEKDCSDVDDWATFQQLIQLHIANSFQLIAMSSNSPNTHCASAMKAFLHFWGYDSIPVYAYQGATGSSSDDGYGSAETHFRLSDTTNLGLVDATTIVSGGVNYQVGDQLLWPLGAGAYGTAGPSGGGANCPYATVQATLNVDTINGGTGAITAWHLVYPGCYATAPGLSSVSPTGGHGTGAVATSTDCHDRCLYQDAEWAIGGPSGLVASNANTYLINSGQSGLDSQLWANHASTMNGGNLVNWLLMQGDIFSGLGEFNAGNSATQWQALYNGSGSPLATVPIFWFDVSNTEEIGGACCSPTSQGYVYAGVQTVAQMTTNPVQWGYSVSSTTTSVFAISSGTYNTSTGATTLTLQIPYVSGVVGGSVSVSSCASSCTGLNGTHTITAVNQVSGTVSFTAATGLGSLTISGGNAATGALVRTDWDFGLVQFVQSGIVLNGTAPANYNYYSANAGTMSNSGGALTWSGTSGTAYFMQRIASDAVENGWVFNIMQNGPGTSNHNQLPLTGVGSLPANDNFRLAANDNFDARARFFQALYTQWDAAIVANKVRAKIVSGR